MSSVPSRSERRVERAERGEIEQPQIDATLAKLVRKVGYSPMELFDAAAPDAARRAARDLAEAKIRACLADALENPTPANFEAVGRCAMVLVHLAMDDAVRDHMESRP